MRLSRSGHVSLPSNLVEVVPPVEPSFVLTYDASADEFDWTIIGYEYHFWTLFCRGYGQTWVAIKSKSEEHEPPVAGTGNGWCKVVIYLNEVEVAASNEVEITN